ncbi:MAG TPA: TonB-dependent receptor plug domain-containing protein [Chitinispirillaceae bacterium]|nr:TonB-dependent receptor plug domain-containing protein [Chitinispirillaceae bacterium]
MPSFLFSEIAGKKDTLKTFAIIFLSYVVLAGSVLDILVVSDDGTSIPACRICVSGIDTCAYSDLNGHAIIGYDNQKKSILFSASGYADTIVSGVPDVDTLTIQLKDLLSIASLATIKVTAAPIKPVGYQLKNRSVLFTSSDIVNTAGTAGDISRYIATLPSVVASISEGYDNTLYVRGGRPTEVLFIVDGIEFENVNHFSKTSGSGGPVGFINADFIKSVNYYAGSMPAEYPSRLSSVINVKMKNGSFTNYKGSAAVKWTGGMLSLEGPLLREYGSIVVAARYINFEPLSKFIDNGGIPKLGDLYAKCLFSPNENLTMYATGLLSYNHNVFRYPSLFSTDSGSIHNITNEIEQIGQGGGGLTISYNNRISQELSLGISFRDGKRYDSLSNFDPMYFWNRFAHNPIWENNVNKCNKSLNYKVRFNIGDIDSLVAGVRMSSSLLSIKYGEYSQYIVPMLTDTLYLLKADTSIASFHGNEAGCFLDIPLQKWYIKADIGLRYDYFGLLGKHTLSPSIVTDFTLPSSGVFTLSYGLYHQFPTEVPLLLFTTFSTRRYLTSDSLEKHELQLLKDVKPYRCQHYGIGYKTILFDHFLIKSDMYYKWYDREFLYTSKSTISVIEMGSNGVYRISSQNGKRKSMGIELMLNNDCLNWYYFSIGGSLFRVLNKYRDGQWYPDWTDVRYTFSISNRISFLKHHMVSLTATAMGGRPYTKQKTQLSFTNVGSEWFNDRLDRICYVNFRYVYTTKIRVLHLEGSIEILNLFNAQPALDYRFNGERYIKIVPFGITPIVGIAVNL